MSDLGILGWHLRVGIREDNLSYISALHILNLARRTAPVPKPSTGRVEQ